HFRYAIDNAAKSADYTSTAVRNRFVILQSGELDRLAALKEANPDVKVLMYKDLGGMVGADDWGGAASGVSTQEADANPDWYLLNTTGQPFTFWGFNWIWAADIGNTAYQQRWAENVIALLQRDGWDGVF